MIGVDRARALYREKYGADTERVFSAPGRVNLIGEHTDYNGGLVLPVAISERTWVAVGRNSDGYVRVCSEFSPAAWSMSLHSPEPPADQGWGLYPLGVAWLLHQKYGLSHGVNLALSSSVPIGAGLSSSAALESATALAVASYLNDTPPLLELAELGQEAENTIVHAPTGLMDQIASLMSQENHATLVDFADLAISHHPLDLPSAGLTLMVVDTRVRHSHSTGEYGQRRRECEAASVRLSVPSLSHATLDRLRKNKDILGPVLHARAMHVVSENQRVREVVDALDSGNLDTLGPLFHQSHQSLRDHFEVSCPELDCAVEEAYGAGALAARMTGGGFGGAAIVISPADKAHHIAKQISKQFALLGFVEPHIFHTEISAGARQEA